MKVSSNIYRHWTNPFQKGEWTVVGSIYNGFKIVVTDREDMYRSVSGNREMKFFKK